MLISFNWTLEAFLAGAKICTRRSWNDDYAAKFIGVYKRGDPVDAWDKLPRAHGKPIGKILLTEMPIKQRTGLMTEQDFIDEGLFWMQCQCIMIQGKQPQYFFRDWKLSNEDVWVIRFKKVAQ